jgi:hypothetical protein
MMRLILNCFGEVRLGCDYAVVEITPELVARVRKRVDVFRATKQQDKHLYELSYCDCSCKFYAWDVELEDQLEQVLEDNKKPLDEGGWAVLPNNLDLASYAQ